MTAVISLSEKGLRRNPLNVDRLRADIKQDPAWELLRRRIVPEGLHLTDKVVFDFRRLLTDPSAALLAGKLLWRMLKALQPQVLIGPGYGATPLLYAIAAAAIEDGVELSVLHVHDRSTDDKADGRWVTGTIRDGHVRAIIVDDFMDSGTAYPVVRHGLAQSQHKLDIQAFALFFDMWQPLGSRQFSVAELPVLPLFRRHDIGMNRDAYDARPPLMQGDHPPFIDTKPLWWRFSLNESKAHPRKSTPVIANNAVFAADDQSRVWRHHAITGDIEWCYESLAKPKKGIIQRLQYADSSLVFGCYDGTLTRLNALNGEVLWRWRQDSSIHATPELDLEHSRLFINTEQWNDGEPFGHLWAMNWTTGKALWKLDHSWWPPGSPSYDRESNIVVATCNDQTIVAVNADNGEILWKRETAGLVRGKPAFKNNRILVLTERGYLICYEAVSGTEVWKKRYGRGLQHQFVTTFRDLVFAFDAKWHLLAFRIDTGELAWLSRLRSPGAWCPIIYGDYLLALSQEGHLAVVDLLIEKKIWEGKISGRYQQPPAIGMCDHGLLLSAASNDDGLKTFLVNSAYLRSEK